MSQHRPASNQMLFKFMWHDEADDRPDDAGDIDADDPFPAPPPLRGRVQRRHTPPVARLWGVMVPIASRPLSARQSHGEGSMRNSPVEARRPVLEAMRPPGARTEDIRKLRTQTRKG
jgi:hypothetical protein